MLRFHLESNEVNCVGTTSNSRTFTFVHLPLLTSYLTYFLTNSLTYSIANSISNSLTYFLTNNLTYSLTYSITNSLTNYLIYSLTNHVPHLLPTSIPYSIFPPSKFRVSFYKITSILLLIPFSLWTDLLKIQKLYLTILRDITVCLLCEK